MFSIKFDEKTYFDFVVILFFIYIIQINSTISAQVKKIECLRIRNYDYLYGITSYHFVSTCFTKIARIISITIILTLLDIHVQSTTMNEREDSAWVFDSLIGFLQGPVWSAPLLTFIEEKSLIFEAETEECEDYHKIYQEYKNLVDLLLGCFMEDMGITPEQFEHACAVNKNTKLPVQFQQSLFEQIWAANEYIIFKRMMIQKNLELQLQALNMIEQKFGLTPASLVYEAEGLQDDEFVMEELIHKRIMEDSVNTESVIPLEESFDGEHQRLTLEYYNERALLEEALKTSAESSEVLPLRQKVNVSSNVSQNSVETEVLPELHKLTPLNPIPAKTKEVECTKEEDIRRRQEYLKARRDKLVALKKEARSQRLEMNNTRPSSARIVAEATMKGKQELNSTEALEPSILHVRKALAARLKAEVVHK